MDRRQFVKSTGAATVSAALTGCATMSARKQTASNSRPNIVILLADDMGYGDVSRLNPESKIPTPNMDSIGKNGITFTDAHSPCAVCTPTRYGILTGRYCWRSSLKQGVLHGYSPLLIEPTRMTIASMLKQKGYRTGCVGKWHLGLGWKTKSGQVIEKHSRELRDDIDFTQPTSNGPNSVGFDYFFGIPASLDMEPYCFVENDRVVDPPDDIVAYSEYPAFYREGPISPGFTFESVLPTLTNKAIRFINESAKSEQPFFLYLPFASPHTPWVPNDFVKGKSRAGVYGDFVYETDLAVGRILNALKQNGVEDNTLVVLTSDNGAYLDHIGEFNNGVSGEGYNFGHQSNYIYRGQKGDAWDGGNRVAFMAKWPGHIQANSWSDEPIGLVDLMATMADITGSTMTEEAAPDSFSIKAAMRNQKYDAPIRPPHIVQSSRGVFCIRDGDWKLIMGRGSGGFTKPAIVKPKPGEPIGQLYRINQDVGEEKNAYNEYPEVVERMTKLFEQFYQQGHSRVG